MAHQEQLDFDPFDDQSAPQNSFGQDSFGQDPFRTTPQNSFGQDSFDPFNSFDVGTAPRHVQAILAQQGDDDEDDVPFVPKKVGKVPKTKLEPMAEEEEDPDIAEIVAEDVLDTEGHDVAKIAYLRAGHSEGEYASLVEEKDGLQSENSRLALENAILMQHCMVAAQSAAAASQWVAESYAQTYALTPGMPGPPGIQFPGAWGEYPGSQSLMAKGRKDRKKAGPKAKVAPAPKSKKLAAEVKAVPEGEQTTAVLRNTPTVFTRTNMLKLLDAGGFANLYNFVYVPFDFKFHKSVGFAFVNLTTPEHARKFMQHFEGFTDWGVPGDWKTATVNWASPHQGLEAHVEHFKNSPVMHESVPDEQRPAIFKDGQRVDFPEPTADIRPPRMRPGHVTGRRIQLIDGAKTDE